MAIPMSAVRSGEQLARRVVANKKGKPAGATRAVGAASTGKVAAAETPGATRRAHVEARNEDAASRKPARGKVSAGEVAKAQRAAIATRTNTPAMVQRRAAQRHAESVATRRDPSAGARTRNAASAADNAVMERVVRESAADGSDGPPRPAQEASAPARAASNARRNALGAASPRRVRRTPRAASERAAMAARTHSAAANHSSAPTQTRASARPPDDGGGSVRSCPGRQRGAPDIWAGSPSGRAHIDVHRSCAAAKQSCAAWSEGKQRRGHHRRQSALRGARRFRGGGVRRPGVAIVLWVRLPRIVRPRGGVDGQGHRQGH